jgi:hypothetical protein
MDEAGDNCGILTFITVDRGMSNRSRDPLRPTEGALVVNTVSSALSVAVGFI